MLLSDLSNALLRDIRNLVDYADDYNVSIQVGEEPAMEVFRAHSVILRARSPYFRIALSAKWATKKDGFVIYKKPNISPRVFKDVLRYIYTGIVDLDKEVKEELLELLVAADELVLEELVEYVQDHIIHNESEWLRRNIVHVHQTSTRHKSCGKLKAYCEERICEDASLIFQSDDFVSLEGTSLISLLKRDDLGMEEIQIWDYVIKWASAQNPEVSSNASEWSSKDVAAMKRTLQECIPHIRFFQISSTDYYYKVRPYKKLLPHDLKENLKLYYMVPKSEPDLEILPPRKSARLPDSIIITAQHAALISSWIDRRETSNEPLEFGGIPYEFKLIARGSRDGFSRQTFKNRCDKQGPTVVVIKGNGLSPRTALYFHWALDMILRKKPLLAVSSIPSKQYAIVLQTMIVLDLGVGTYTLSRVLARRRIMNVRLSILQVSLSRILKFFKLSGRIHDSIRRIWYDIEGLKLIPIERILIV
ncbi:12508_t:CDS:2 [Acaulospora colombiana]|uniref:12508_t:CDS:1 n=1 Tax=Acaulospora colombiana TaxID=27376 RepID=A0ACA9KXS9_9GLOM|nr:12508_t:CDS:2 [Acaulospora colombiana]